MNGKIARTISEYLFEMVAERKELVAFLKAGAR